MSSPSKKKGTAFESAVRDYQKQFFPFVERLALNGSKDLGDLTPINGGVQEVKCQKAMDLGPWLNEARNEAENAGLSRYWVIHKRRGVGDVAESFVTMPLWLLMELLLDESATAA